MIRSTTPLTPKHPTQRGLVSVVAVQHDGRSLESALRGACAQRYSDIEVLVVGDGAPAADPRVRYIDAAAAVEPRNAAMLEARGEYVAFLDANDEWEPWRIECQVAALARHPDAGIAWTDMTLVDDSGAVTDLGHLRGSYERYGRVAIDAMMSRVATLGQLACVPGELGSDAVLIGDLAGQILLGNVLHSSTILIRREWAERTGGFDPAFVLSVDDYEFFVRLCSVGPAVFIDAPALRRRVGHAEQRAWSSMMVDVARNTVGAIKKWAPRDGVLAGLPKTAIRRRLADAFAWLAEAELEAGHRLAAVRGLTASLMTRPALDRRAKTFLRCAIPSRLL